MAHIALRTTSRALAAATLSFALGVGTAGRASGQTPVPSERDVFVAIDSTFVVLVPTGASPVSVLGAVRAIRGRTAAAVYTTDDAAAVRLGTALVTAVGGSLIPYDRAGATADAYAARLLRNAVTANPHGTVLIVGGPELSDPVYRAAAAASGLVVPADARAGGERGQVLVLTVAPNTRALVRARL